VVGVTNDSDAGDLWKMGKQLFEVYKRKNPIVKSVPQIDTEASALAFAIAWYQQQGVVYDKSGELDDVGTVLERYKLTFQVDLIKGIDWDVGEKIRFQFPITGAIHKGYIESISKDLTSMRCNVTAQMVGGAVNAYTLIIEGVVGADTITEGFVGVDTITEGEV